MERPKFGKLRDYARPGDTVHISEMFRLVRGNQHILDVLEVLHRDRLALRIHDGAFSSMDLTARQTFLDHPHNEDLPPARTERRRTPRRPGRLLIDTEIPMRLRVAGVIVLLYAQPLSRVVRLTLDDVIRNGDAVLLRLGEPPSPVPAPVSALLLEHITNRGNMNTATNPTSRWFFPGRRTGQPLGPNHLSALLNEVGIPIAAARGAAIRQQLLELPAPVVANALGYHNKTTSRLRNETGGTWSRYAAGDHGRSPVGWAPKTTGES
ncbi:recombinase family protein [Streptomyces sp. SCSIO 30461]|uniref:recombinase family protein n=1 Tax=Streptomyces sp. SCSIO 30461 TaxID=3118085 RepID=UPI00387ED2FE